MKISTLSAWQFVGLMIVLLVGVGIIFRLIEKKIRKPMVPASTETVTPSENTTIDTSNGAVAKVRYS